MAATAEVDSMNFVEDDEDDLFGDGGSEVEERELSDRELDSGDDEDRNDRTPAVDQDVEMDDGKDLNVMDASIARHIIPKTSDGEVSLGTKFTSCHRVP